MKYFHRLHGLCGFVLQVTNARLRRVVRLLCYSVCRIPAGRVAIACGHDLEHWFRVVRSSGVLR